MTARFFVDANGAYLGTFDASALAADQQKAWYDEHVPAGAVEVPVAPAHGLDTWNGSTWTPAQVLPPAVVSARQARRALAATPAPPPATGNMKSLVDAWVAQQGADIQIDWEFSTEIHRASGTVISAAQALGLTDAQLDQLFTLAATFT